MGPWLSSEPTGGTSPLRLFPRRSKLTATGILPYSGGIRPEKELKERLRTPERLGSAASEGGSDPLKKLEERSRRDRAVRLPISPGRRPARRLPERSRVWREVRRESSEGR